MISLIVLGAVNSLQSKTPIETSRSSWDPLNRLASEWTRRSRGGARARFGGFENVRLLRGLRRAERRETAGSQSGRCGEAVEGAVLLPERRAARGPDRRVRSRRVRLHRREARREAPAARALREPDVLVRVGPHREARGVDESRGEQDPALRWRKSRFGRRKASPKINLRK